MDTAKARDRSAQRSLENGTTSGSREVDYRQEPSLGTQQKDHRSLEGSSRRWQTWDDCWNGNRWTENTPFAQRFDTREEAQQYTDENRELLETSR